jgi:hypothetical protein
MKIYENGNNWIIEDQLDKGLVEKIKNLVNLNLKDFLRKKEGYSTTGKNAEQYWLIKQDCNFYFKNKNFRDIEKDYKTNVLNRLKKSNLLNEKLKYLELDNNNCWSVVGEEYSFHTPHFHNNAMQDGISTVLYLNVPESNVENSPENNLFLIMNSESNSLFYNSNPKIININPEVGKLLIFPDWIIHGTNPQTKGIRQTFNIDYRFTFDSNNKKILNNNLNYA